MRFKQELRYLYNAATHYREPLVYLYHRFYLGPRIKRRSDPIDHPPVEESYSIHVLTARRDLVMLLWSLASWYEVVSRSAKVFIHEDGSFTAKDKELLKRLLPHSQLVDFRWASSQIDNWLAPYPNTLQYRQRPLTDKRHIYAVKLLDPHFISSADEILIIDSDLLWFQRPEELLRAREPVMMRGTAQMDFQFRDGSLLPEEVGIANSGIVKFPRQGFDLGVVEEFISRVGDNANPHFIEQAGYAYVLGKRNLQYLPQDRYHIKGRVSPTTIVKHYTGPRREEFWFEGVKILKDKFL